MAPLLNTALLATLLRKGIFEPANQWPAKRIASLEHAAAGAHGSCFDGLCSPTSAAWTFAGPIGPNKLADELARPNPAGFSANQSSRSVRHRTTTDIILDFAPLAWSWSRLTLERAGMKLATCFKCWVALWPFERNVLFTGACV